MPADSGAATAARVIFEDSIMAVPVDAPASKPHRVRAGLTDAELDASLDFVVSLRMRNFDELETRIQSGAVIPRAEMEANYLPTRADHDRVASWLKSQGFAMTLVDSNHTNLFARGRVGRISDALGLMFARVSTSDGEFTSAVTPPSLPAEISAPVLCISGLQPHIHARHPRRGSAAAGGLGSLNGTPTPADVAYAYNVPASLTGAGQTIAIICDSVPLSTDLTQFWSLGGINQSTANLTVVNVEGGAAANGDQLESTLDVEWAGGMASGAAIRFYAIPNFQYSTIVAAATQILNDLPQHPGMNQVSVSIVGPENEAGSSATLESYSQTYAQLAAAGISVFFCSGDGGSNPDPDVNTLAYSPLYPLTVEYPACDSNVTAVGGTTLSFNSNWISTGETTWFTTHTNTVGSGGGLSAIFSRPSWQTGTGVPPGSARCVPDVAAQANSEFGYLNGQMGNYWGTSFATPIWAAVAAIVNQARASGGLPPLGLLGPRIYPLIGTSAFNDITTGTNGAYNATLGYDFCTGLGTPNVGVLAAALGPPLAITVQPTPQAVGAGANVTLTAAVSGATSYQWQLNGANVAGATNSALTLANIGTTQRGSYTVVASNALGSVTSNPAAVTVNVNSYLYNISTLGYVGPTTSQSLVGGFYTTGSGSKNIVVRGIGPNLAVVQPSLSGLALATPSLTLYNATSAVGTNTAWGGGQTLINAFNTVFAPVFATNSKDTAFYMSVPAGPGIGYTAEIDGVSGATGVAQIEVYDYDSYVGTPASRLINISTRGYVGASGGLSTATGISRYQYLDAGFYVIGNTAQTLLIRAVGPGEAGVFPGQNLTKAKLTLYDSSGNVIATNAGWGNAPVLGNSTVAAGIQPATTAIMNSVYAGTIAAGSNDSAMVVTLPTGTSGVAGYTAAVTSADGASAGIALVEVYNLP